MFLCHYTLKKIDLDCNLYQLSEGGVLTTFILYASNIAKLITEPYIKVSFVKKIYNHSFLARYLARQDESEKPSTAML